MHAIMKLKPTTSAAFLTITVRLRNDLLLLRNVLPLSSKKEIASDKAASSDCCCFIEKNPSQKLF